MDRRITGNDLRWQVALVLESENKPNVALRSDERCQISRARSLLPKHHDSS